MKINEIKCGSIWGGTRNLDEDVTAGGIRASVHSRAWRSDEGGDIYYLSVCGGDLLARVAIADVAGHGAAVADVSGWLYDAMAERLQDVDGQRILEELNHRTIEYGGRAFATAAVVAYYRADGRLYFSYAGHPPVLVRRADSGIWTPAEIAEPTAGFANLPLSVIDDVVYDQGSMAISPGDRVLVFTDGLLEARNASGELFGAGRLLETLNSRDCGTTNDVLECALAAAETHAGRELDHDDVTLVAFEVM